MAHKAPLVNLEQGQWIAWIAATIAAAITLTGFVYANFQTKSEAVEQKGDLIQRLDRIEAKVDQLIQK